MQQPVEWPVGQKQLNLVSLVRLSAARVIVLYIFQSAAMKPRAFLLVQPHSIIFCIANLNKFYFIVILSGNFNSFTELYGSKTFDSKVLQLFQNKALPCILGPKMDVACSLGKFTISTILMYAGQLIL